MISARIKYIPQEQLQKTITRSKSKKSEADRRIRDPESDSSMRERREKIGLEPEKFNWTFELGFVENLR